jgi:hypothetical protein
MTAAPAGRWRTNGGLIMGADISLRSVMTKETYDAVMERIRAELPPSPAMIQRYFDDLQATGAYFRDPYNSGCLLNALGMEWSRDVGPLLDENCCLPIPAARHLLAEIEAKHLTPQLIEDICNGTAPRSKTVAMVEEMNRRQESDQSGPRTVPEPGDERVMAEWFARKRERLIRLLRKSIELNEPLYCDI